LTVQKYIESIVVELVNMVGRDLHMVYSDTYGNRSHGDVWIEYFCHPESHVSPATAKRSLMEDLYSYWISWGLRHYESAL
jgi:hypothetical protein